MIMNSQGCKLLELGAKRASSRQRSSVSWGTGSGRKSRIVRILKHALGPIVRF